MQSAIEEFARKLGADGRSRGGDKEAEATLTRQIHNKGDVNMAVLKCHGGDQSK